MRGDSDAIRQTDQVEYFGVSQPTISNDVRAITESLGIDPALAENWIERQGGETAKREPEATA